MANGTIVAADSDRDRIWLLQVGSVTPQEIVLTAGDEPGRVVEGPNGRAFVALRRTRVVAEIDVSSAQLIARHDACPAPRGLGWSSSKQVLTVACATGALARLRFEATDAGFQLGQRVVQHPAEDLRDVLVRTDDVLVSTFRSAQVFRVDDDGGAVELPLPQSFENSSRHVAWRMISGPSGPLVLHQLETNNRLFFGPCSSGYSEGGFFSSPTIDGRLFNVSTQMFEASALPNLTVDVAVSTTGQLAVASPGEWRVKVVGPHPSIPVGGPPTAVGFRGTELVVFTRQPAALSFFTLPSTTPTTVVLLPGASVASTGHELFHTSTRRRIACASCHPEGRDDGHVWNFETEGLRRTSDLLGGLKASAPFHWNGDRANIAALLDDVLTNRMAGAPQSAARSAALIDWLEQLPATPLPENLDLAAVARGQLLFYSVAQQCGYCHSGPLGTNNLNVDVGTGGSFQVPRLVGLASRAPYLHDGRLKTLADRFSPDAGSQHGNTMQLTASEQADLSEYLRSR